MISKNILITGANGFVGNRLLLALSKYTNNRIRVLTRKPVSGFENFYCDFLNNQIPGSAFESVDTVFHLAGFAHDFRTNDIVEDMYQAINVEATIELANLAIKNKVKKFIFVSSIKAGGKPIANKCLDESHQGEPEGAYGRTKREAEIKLFELSKNTLMKIVIIRPSLVYGYGMKGNLKLMLSGIEKGWLPPFPKIDNKRSMVHVDDLVEALILVSFESKANNEIFIVTDGQPHSSREIYETMCTVLGKNIPSWSMPNWIFNLLAIVNKRIRFKINKLINDEWYSSKKIESIGFRPKKTLIHLNENETLF